MRVFPAQARHAAGPAPRWRPIVAGAALATTLLGAAFARAEVRLSLADAITAAQRLRPEAQRAELEVQLARVGLLRAGLDRFRLRAEGRVGEQIDRLNASAPAELCATFEGSCGRARRTLVDLSASLEVPIFAGFALSSGWSRARQLEQASLAARTAQRRALTLEVARAYWTLRAAELLLVAGGRARERRQATAELIRARSEAGIAPRPDRNRAEIALLRHEATLAELAGRVAEARATLAAALQLHDTPALTDDPPPAVPPPPLTDLLAAARAHRPELGELAARAEARRFEVGVIKGGFWPHLSLFARADARNEAFGVPQSSLVGNYSAGVTASWLLFDSFTTYTAARAAEIERLQLGLDQQRMLAVVEAEVKSAHARLQAAIARGEPLRKAATLAEATLELMRRRYQSGAALLFELLEAEDDLEQLEAEVIESAAAVAEAQAALTAAVGR